MRNAISALVLCLFSAVSLAAQCGPSISLESATTREKAPIESAPPNDKAIVYVFADGGMMPGDRNVSIDREWVGVLRTNNYFVTAVSPGQRKLCVFVKGNSPHYLDVTMEAGKTYHFSYDLLGANFTSIPAPDAALLQDKIKTRRYFWQKG